MKRATSATHSPRRRSPRGKAVHAWHIDAEAPIALQSVPDYKTPAQRAACYAPDACRSSDHDAVVIDLALDDSAA
ncbi:hypothetical protein WS75_03470 [Burkholderia sp. FL-7-2-10-S1-D7]|nr:hypothetical protein WS75_03470 [Burkholderia sp. FL-7-2-10-S1-D7]